VYRKEICLVKTFGQKRDFSLDSGGGLSSLPYLSSAHFIARGPQGGGAMKFPSVVGKGPAVGYLGTADVDRDEIGRL
jgi:hypothetical protein